MNILIVEDVTLVAERIADLAKKCLQNCTVTISYTLEDAMFCITEKSFDLLFLDLNLNGKNGFDLLKSATASAFQTIIITANRDQAVAAFEFGVLDFISKPILEERFKTAILRFLNGSSAHREKVKYLTVKSKGVIHLINLLDIEFIKGSGNYAEIHTTQNSTFLHHKNLEKLMQILPDSFVRVHRSYIVLTSKINRILKHGGGKYCIELNSKKVIPLSRENYKQLFMDT